MPLRRAWRSEDYDLFVVTTREPAARLVSAFNFNDPFYADGPCDDPYADALMEYKPGGREICHGALSRRVYLECFPYATTDAADGVADAFARALGEGVGPCAEAARACVHEGDAVCGSNRHLNRGTDWYVADDRGGTASVLTRLRNQSARAFLVRTESFDEDAVAMWDWLCVPNATRTTALNVNPQTIHDRAALETPRHNDTSLSAAGKAALAHQLAREQHAIDALEALADNGIARALSITAADNEPERRRGGQRVAGRWRAWSKRRAAGSLVA